MTRDLQSPGAGQLTTVEEAQSSVRSVLTGVTPSIVIMSSRSVWQKIRNSTNPDRYHFYQDLPAHRACQPIHVKVIICLKLITFTASASSSNIIIISSIGRIFVRGPNYSESEVYGTYTSV